MGPGNAEDMSILAMIPAGMGSQRLNQTNLRELGSTLLITRAIRKCLAADVFDEIWVNSQHQFLARSPLSGRAFPPAPGGAGQQHGHQRAVNM